MNQAPRCFVVPLRYTGRIIVQFKSFICVDDALLVACRVSDLFTTIFQNGEWSSSSGVRRLYSSGGTILKDKVHPSVS